VRKFIRCLGVFGLSFVLLAAALFADENKPKRLRQPDAKKTPCGLYLSDLADSSNGIKVAEPTVESVIEFFDKNPDLIPKLAYRDYTSSKGYASPDDLKQALEAESAEPFVNSVELSWVGLPRWGKRTRELMALTEKKLQEKYPKIKIKVRNLWRPNREMSNLISYLSQEALYLFPSIKLDYQEPIPSEVNSAYSKLVMSNGSQQIFLFFVKPWPIAVTTGAMNFVNSYYTGVYRKFLSNWFSRSKGAPSRWTRNIGLSAFFNANLYWASMGFWGITDPSMWADFAIHKWSSTAFGVLWRYFYGQGIIKWEADYAGHPSDARRTAGRLEFLGTFLTTPAFIYSVVGETVVNVEIAGVPIMGLNGGHFAMLGVGALGALYYFKILSWDPWVKRLDRVHEFNRRWAAKIGLQDLIARVDEAVRRVRALGWRKENGNGQAGAPSLNANIDDFIDLDQELVTWIKNDPRLHEAVHKDPELRKLIESDPHFDRIRDELLAESK